MKNLGEIKELKDIATKEYVDKVVYNLDISDKLTASDLAWNFPELTSKHFPFLGLSSEVREQIKKADIVNISIPVKTNTNSGQYGFLYVPLAKNDTAVNGTISQYKYEGFGYCYDSEKDIDIPVWIQLGIVDSMSQLLFMYEKSIVADPTTTYGVANKNYVDNQISTAGEGKFLPLVDGGRITN